jgi:hypothetical protein
VVLGWVLQAVHLIVFGEYCDDGLQGVGVVIDAVLAAVAVGLALLASGRPAGCGVAGEPDPQPDDRLANRG